MCTAVKQPRSTSACEENSNETSRRRGDRVLPAPCRRVRSTGVRADDRRAGAQRIPVAPDLKITEIEGRTSGLAGGYAGVVIDEHFFIGGGAYVLATDTRGRDMAYGGLILQWMGGGDRF